MTPSRPRPAALAALVVMLAVAGCANPPVALEGLPIDDTPPYAPANYRGDARLPATIQRVAMLPVYGGSVAEPESTTALDAVLLSALQRQTRFEVVVVTREDCQRMFGAGEFSSTAALPHGFMEKLAAHYAVDAVLFTDLTVYQPYRPLALGFRAKLADTHEMRLVWAFDEVMSADDNRMRSSVRAYYRRGDRSAPVEPARDALQSPSRFGAVAADLMFRTLPPR